MDPFDVRIRFTQYLTNLTASHTTHQRTAIYALRNRSMDEDLHSCILEQLESSSLNARANIMYFIETLTSLAKQEGALEFVRMMQRDILRVVDAVVPGDGSGAANVRVVRKVLAGLGEKGVLMRDTVGELEDILKEREREGGEGNLFVSAAGDEGTEVARRNNGARLDKRQIEQRIEEDRERHKRARESIWAVPGENEAEMERLWEEASEVGEDDWTAAQEDMLERRQAVALG
jgi:CTD kinase subunit gamma